MKKFAFIIFCLCLSGVSSFSQVKKTPVKRVAKTAVALPAVSEISNPEWSELTGALETENFDKAALLSAAALKKLKADNDKKQLASLRYFYLYALAGKVQQKKTLYAEFEKISQAFIGKEFLLPNRKILADCTGKVNYICPVKSDSLSLRTTATTKAADTIIFFEYIQLNEALDFSTNNQKNAFVSGKLTKVESSAKNNMTLIRLFFEEGKAEITK